MELEINIGKVLKEHHLDSHGRVNELAAVAGIHRHSMRGLMNGTATHVKVESLEALCKWFHQQTGLSDAELLRAFFQFRPDLLWEALAATGHVSILRGEYRQTEPNSPTRLWVSRRDTAVANAVCEELNQYSIQKKKHVQVEHIFVPFRFAMRLPDIKTRHFQEDTRQAKRIFRNLRSRKGHGASVLIGSQEVNYAVECFVASLFRTRPFRRPDDEAQVPFHVKSRHTESAMESCFGGAISPPGYPDGKEELPAGIYWLNAKGKWVDCRRIEREQDAGLVIVSWDAAADTIDVVLFGVSGRATAEMVEWVVRRTEAFWPPYCVAGNKRVGVYICRFEVDPKMPKEPYGNLAVLGCEVIRLDAAALKQFL